MNNGYTIFCVGSGLETSMADIIVDWLWLITKKWETPNTVNYCGHAELETVIKDWSQIFFGCKFLETEETKVLTPRQQQPSPKTMSILSQRTSSSDESEIFSPRLRGRKKSSPRAFRKWVEDAVNGGNNIVIFTNTEIGSIIYNLIPLGIRKILISI